MNVMRIYPASFVLSMRAALTSASVAVAADYTWAGAQGGKWRLPIIEQAFARKSSMRFVMGLVLTAFIFIQSAAHATSGNWNTNAAGIWSDAANWNPAVVPGTSAGDVVGLTFNINAARTNTIDGAVASRTVGTLNIGDPATGFFAYTLAASGGGTLTFNNGGSGAKLVQTLTTASDLISAPLILADNLSVNNSSTLTLSGIIGDGGAGKGITKFGAGTLTNSAANTYTGPTTVAAGTLAYGIADAIGSGALIVNGGTLALGGYSDTVGAVTLTAGSITGTGGTLTSTSGFTLNNVLNTPVISAILAGSVPLTKTDVGTVTLSTNNTYTGVTTVNAGVLQLNATSALPGGIGTAGGTSALTLNGGVLGLGNGNFTRSLAAAGTATGVNFTGAGGWAAYGAARTVNLGGALAQVTWATADTGFNGQTLILAASTANNTVDLQNPVDLGSAMRIVQVDNGSAATDAKLSGNLTGSGSGGLTKTGAGTLQLSGASTYPGATTVTAGTLELQFGTGNNLSGVIGSSSPLTLGNATTLSVLGGATAIVDTQAFNGTTLPGGQSAVSLAKGTATSVTLNMGTLVNSTKSFLNFTIPSATSVTVSRAALDASGALLGTWASVGSAATLAYAADNNAVNGSITSYSSATAATVADLSNVSSPTANYKYAAAATLAGNQTGNTLQYTGAATTTALGANSLTLNGLMNAGTGLLTITNSAGSPGLVIGANGELDIIANTQGIKIPSVISGTGALVYGGPSAGTLTLSGANTFDGGTFLNGGTLSVSADSAFGTVPVTATTNLTFGGNSTLKATSSFTLNVNRNISIINGANATFDLFGKNILNIEGVISGSGSLTMAGGAGDNWGFLHLKGANTYSGGTVLYGNNNGYGGGLYIYSDASLGTAPASSTPNFTYSGGYQVALTWMAPFDLNPNRTLVSSGGQMTLTFFANQNIKFDNLITGTGSLVLAPSGTGSVTLANPRNSFNGIQLLGGTLKIGSDAVLGTPPASPADNIALSRGGTIQLLASFDLHPNRNFSGGNGYYLTLDTQGFNMTIPGDIMPGNNGLSKAGSGVLTLTGIKTYNYQTSIYGGLLRVNGVISAAGSQSAMTIYKSGALGGTGSVPFATVTAAIGDASNAGGAIRLADGAVGTLTLGTNLTFSGSVAYPNSLFFDLGNAGSGDKIVVGGAHSAANPAGSALIYLNQLPGTTGAGTYTLIQGGLTSVTNGYALATTRAGRNVYTLSASGNNLQVAVSAGGAGSGDLFSYWKGNTAFWNTAQWYSDAGGTVTAVAPGYGSNVRFAASGYGNLTNTLGQDFEINSLTVDAGLPATIISNNVLAIAASSDNGNTAGNGITVNNAAGTTIASKVILSSNQTWTVGSGAALTVSGVIAEGGGGSLLTKAGAGTLTLSGANNYFGGTTVSDGVLRIGTGGTTGALSPVGNILNNASMIFNRADTITQGVGFGDISGSGDIIQAGAGTLVLNRNNGYTGQAKISVGTLSVGATENLGVPSASLLFDGGTLQITGTMYTNFGHAVAFTAAKTVGIDVNAAANVFTADQVLDQTTGGLVKSGLGTLALSTANTYSGVTIISNGVLRLNHAAGLPGGIGSTGGKSALTFNSVDTDGSSGAIYTGVIGLGNGDFSRPLAAAGTADAVTFTGSGGWAAFGADRSVNLGGASAQVAWGTAGTGLNAKTLVLGASSATHTVDFRNPLDLGSSTRTIQVDNGAADIDAKLSGVLSGTGGLNIFATGTLALTGPNTYSGATYLGSGGTLVVSSFNSVNTDPGLGTVRSASSSLGVPTTATNGKITLGGWNNNFVGAILRYVGTGETTDRGIYLQGQGATYTIDQSGTGLLKFVTPITLASAYNQTLVLQGTTNGTGEIAANIPPSGAGVAMSVTKAGTGTWTLSGANTFRGATTVNAGTLKAGIATVVGSYGAFGTNSAVTLANAAGVVLDLANYDNEIGSLAGVGPGGSVTLGTAALTVGRNNTSTTYAGVISGTGGRLVKIGTGTNTLSGVNSYSGGTTVNGGTLLLTSPGTLGSGDVTVTAGTLTLNTATAIADTKRLTIADGGGAKVSVVAGSTETVNELYFGTKQQVAGTWSASGATNNDTTHFTGTGIINVLKGPIKGTMIMIY